MVATLPTNFTPIHAPTAAEMGQIINGLLSITNVGVFTSLGTCSLSIGSGTVITDISGATMSYTKQQGSTGSNLLAMISVGWRSATATTGAKFYISINGVDTALAIFESDVAQQHVQTIGWGLVTGLGAGAYNPKIRAQKLVNNSNNVFIDNNDTVTMLVAELPL